MYDVEDRLRSALHHGAPEGWSVPFEPIARGARVRRNLRSVTAAGASALAVAAVAVTATSLVPAATPSPPPVAGGSIETRPTPGPTAGHCVRGHDPALDQIDYVDFVQFGGRQYEATGERVPTIPMPSGTPFPGPRIGTVECTLSEILPGADYRPRDGDASYLPVGTVLHSVVGMPISSAIAAAA
jgi:hypothetical protein